MQPLEILTPMDEPNEEEREALDQLAFAYQRSEAVLTGSEDELLAEGIRRAEAILFVSPEPLSAEQINEILPHGTEAANVLMALKASYAGRGVELVEVAGKWRFQTATDMAFLFVEERQVQKKLSQASLETLAIIAYGQPVTRAEIEAVRGVAVSKTTLDTLMETGWVRTCGQRQTPGQPMTYGTTSDFLEHFGLESLDVLPGKADLDAEGLLSDTLPDDFLMPGEEALAEEDIEAAETEDHMQGDASFVTDFMEEEADSASEEETAHNGLGDSLESSLAESEPVAGAQIISLTGEEIDAAIEAELEALDMEAEADCDIAEVSDEAEESEPDVESAVIALARATSDIVSPTAISGIEVEDDAGDEKPVETHNDEDADWENW